MNDHEDDDQLDLDDNDMGGADNKMINAVNKNFVDSPPAQGVLAKLFRKIVADLDIGAFGWSQLMQAYLDNRANGIAQNAKDRSTARGNLNKELNRGQLSWKVFLKAIRFFGAVRADFTVKLWFANKKVTEHTVTMFDRVPVKRGKDPYEPSEDRVGLSKPLFDDDKKPKQ